MNPTEPASAPHTAQPARAPDFDRADPPKHVEIGRDDTR